MEQKTEAKSDKDLISELKKQNDLLTSTLQKREEQLEINSRLIAEFNEKNQEMREEIDGLSDQVLELQNKLDKKVSNAQMLN